MTHQDVPTSSTIHLMYVPTHQIIVSTMYLNHIPKTYTNMTIKSYLTIHHSNHKPNTINPYIKPCAKTSLLCSLKHVPFIIQSYTKTTNKFLSQCNTIYANKTKLSAPTMYFNKSASKHSLQQEPYN